MRLIYCKDKNTYKHLNASLLKIDKYLWIGHCTNRELDNILNVCIDVNKIKVFNVSTKDKDNYFNKTLDFLSE